LPAKRIIAAATRFKEAWNPSLRADDAEWTLSDIDIVEMHDAALGLILATGTDNLQEALDVLHAYDAD
jgi:hypothetical protein